MCTGLFYFHKIKICLRIFPIHNYITRVSAKQKHNNNNNNNNSNDNNNKIFDYITH